MSAFKPLKKWPGGIGESEPGDALTATGAIDEAPPVTLASAATVSIGAAAANTINITGTTTITAFDSIAAGAKRTIIFGGALTLTHNATSLTLPGAADILTAAGDVMVIESKGSGNWKCTGYMRASGQPLLVAIASPYCTSGGSANAQTLTTIYLPARATAYVQGMQWRARVATTNTGAATVNIDGLGTKTLVTVTGVALPAGYLRTDVDTLFTYDGTNVVASREVERGSNASGAFVRYADGVIDLEANVSFDMNRAAASVTTYPYPAALITRPLKCSACGPVTLTTSVLVDVAKVLLQLQASNWRLILSQAGTTATAQSFDLSASGYWY